MKRSNSATPLSTDEVTDAVIRSPSGAQPPPPPPSLHHCTVDDRPPSYDNRRKNVSGGCSGTSIDLLRAGTNSPSI
jgi:hypothetical protein